jgi:SAM-dependent methyltransferase
MTSYGLAYRLGFTPWERYGRAAGSSVAAHLDREEVGRPRPLGRALDLGCGRGQYTPELARRGWEAVGIDEVPRAVAAARRRSGGSGASFVVGDVTNLSDELGRFDFFLDVGCFQGLRTEQRIAEGRGIRALADPGATLLMLAFRNTGMRAIAGGASRNEIEAAFPDWQVLSVEAADTAGLGWPLRGTAPRWYRLRREA